MRRRRSGSLAARGHFAYSNGPSLLVGGRNNDSAQRVLWPAGTRRGARRTARAAILCAKGGGAQCIIARAVVVIDCGGWSVAEAAAAAAAALDAANCRGASETQSQIT